MTPAPIDPSFAVRGPEWSVGGVDPLRDSGAPATGEGFGDMLAKQVQNLEQLQTNAAEQSRALATGQAEDLTAVVTAVERARLSMELAAQIRTKAVEAYHDIFRTQV